MTGADACAVRGVVTSADDATATKANDFFVLEIKLLSLETFGGSELSSLDVVPQRADEEPSTTLGLVNTTGTWLVCDGVMGNTNASDDGKMAANTAKCENFIVQNLCFSLRLGLHVQEWLFFRHARYESFSNRMVD